MLSHSHKIPTSWMTTGFRALLRVTAAKFCFGLFRSTVSIRVHATQFFTENSLDCEPILIQWENHTAGLLTPYEWSLRLKRLVSDMKTGAKSCPLVPSALWWTDIGSRVYFLTKTHARYSWLRLWIHPDPGQDTANLWPLMLGLQSNLAEVNNFFIYHSFIWPTFSPLSWCSKLGMDSTPDFTFPHLYLSQKWKQTCCRGASMWWLTSPQQSMSQTTTRFHTFTTSSTFYGSPDVQHTHTHTHCSGFKTLQFP